MKRIRNWKLWKWDLRMISFLSFTKNFKSAWGEESIKERRTYSLFDVIDYTWSLVVQMRSDTRDSKEFIF